MAPAVEILIIEELIDDAHSGSRYCSRGLNVSSESDGMPNARVLVTGFEPYGGRDLNPAEEVMKRLDGQTLFDCDIVGRSLTVRFSALLEQIASLLEDVQPDIVISLGLWPGESLIRIERVALNVADFDIVDNAGERVIDQPVSHHGETALLATLPIRAIETALLDEGIPAQVSNTAGTFLCNACLYGFLEAASQIDKPMKCGFLHVPYLPEQVADLIVRQRAEAKAEIFSNNDLASMDLGTLMRAVKLAIGASVA